MVRLLASEWLLQFAAPVAVLVAACIAAVVTARRALDPASRPRVGKTVAWLIVALVAFGIGCCYGTLSLGAGS